MPDLLLEIGCEEIPAGFLPEGRAALREAVRKGLGALAGELVVTGTPRRIILTAKGLPLQTREHREEVKGPPLKVALDAAGNPTNAARGFAAKVGVAVEKLERRDGYLWGVQVTPGRATNALLAEILPAAMTRIPWPKSQRWDATGTRFVRPVRWILATFGGKPIPFAWGGLKAGTTSRVWALSGKRVIRKPVPFARLAAAGVRWDLEKRAAFLEKEIRRAAKRAGAEPIWPEESPGKTALYLADHVECPRIVAVPLDPALLAAPDEVLILTMWKHQKFIPLQKNGRIAPTFLVVGDETFGGKKGWEENVRSGASRVVAARLSDARYFWDADRAKGITALREETKRQRWAEGLGTVHDRSERLSRAASALAEDLGMSTGRSKIERAARLSKFDLATKLVFEFPELEGVVGRRIAESAGELPEIALALAHHYRPKGPADGLPEGFGIPVALADKADLLVGIFAIGKEPSASADPFGLRRAAIGIHRILIDRNLDLPLPRLLAVAAVAYAQEGRAVDEAARGKVLAFLRTRLAGLLEERGRPLGARVDHVEAVLSADASSPADAARRLTAFLTFSRTDAFEPLVVSSKRVTNILEGKEGLGEVDPALLREESEQALLRHVVALEKRLDEIHDHAEAFREISLLRPVLDDFFVKILVNAPEPDLRENRKRLLRRLGRVLLRRVDLSKISS